MRFAILANPVCYAAAGPRCRDDLAYAAGVLGAEIFGLDTTSSAGFKACAQQLAGRCETLVVAGGDGSFSDIINAIDTVATRLAFLPLGHGNALKYALGYRVRLPLVAARIRAGTLREFDLIDCDGRRRAFAASIGFDGLVINLHESYRATNSGGLLAYSRAFLRAWHEFSGCDAEVRIDGRAWRISRLLSLMVVKQPYFGFGMKVVPQARFDDGRLHIRATAPGAAGALLAAVSSFTVGNRIGQYAPGQTVEVALQRPLIMQVDGGQAWRASRFRFSVLPKALRMVV